jgi:hypothetical protein
MVIGMQHGYGHAAWKWTFSIDMDKYHGHRHAAGGHRSIVVLSLAFHSTFPFTFTVLPAWRLPTNGGRPSLLLPAYLGWYLTADVLLRDQFSTEDCEVFRQQWQYLKRNSIFSKRVKIPCALHDSWTLKDKLGMGYRMGRDTFPCFHLRPLGAHASAAH